MSAPVVNFIKCPFCSGHDAIGEETADLIGELIAHGYSTGFIWHDAAPELKNVLNTILNYQQRRVTAEAPNPDGDPLLD